MACTSCGTDGDKSKGCRSNGGCDSGGCNKLNTYDWLSTMELEDPSEVNLVEVSFRNGAHKAFFKLQNMLQAETGDTVVVEADGGYDVGEISLKGALVPLQMKKKSVDINTAVRSVMRVASQQDVDKLVQARSNDRDTMVRARAISAMLGIDMKIGDVEFRADMKKATFFYTADGRVDFRELIRHFAKEFRVKIEMRQIGSRQESSRIGGLGSCGRELCCSTWLTDYKSVTTNAARYQNLSINQAKLSGQCGRLKCCLNYELDVYMEALEDFPTNADNLQYAGGYAKLIKTDIFKKLMFYIKKDKKGREAFITMTVDEVVAMQKDISRGKIPEDIVSTRVEYLEDIDHMKSEDLTGHIELPEERRKAKKKIKAEVKEAAERKVSQDLIDRLDLKAIRAISVMENARKTAHEKMKTKGHRISKDLIKIDRNAGRMALVLKEALTIKDLMQDQVVHVLTEVPKKMVLINGLKERDLKEDLMKSDQIENMKVHGLKIVPRINLKQIKMLYSRYPEGKLLQLMKTMAE